MNIMVVGGGGREHAIIKKIKENPNVTTIYALPGNGGIAADATCVDIGAKDIDGIVAFAKANSIDFAIVAPDDPLVLGAVDALNEIGIKCFGPKANAAIIEGSKVFSKNLMKKYGIPTAEYEVFSDMESALSYLDTAAIPVVVKADGLALGKGVIIANTREEAKDAVKSMMLDKVFGESGSNVVILNRSRGFRAQFYRRKVNGSHGIIYGPQESKRQRRGTQYRRYGNSCPQSLLYRGNCGRMYGKDFPTHNECNEQ